MRIRQWSKNLLVFIPLIFARRASDLESVKTAVLYFFAFCFVSSGSYLINDILDRERDRAHPLKARRPIASGRIAPSSALFFAVILIAAGFSVSAAADLGAATAVLGAYLLLQILYNASLRAIPGADITAIALGFVLRAVGGAVAIDVVFSEWLILAAFFGASRIALGKRQSELATARSGLRAGWEAVDESKLAPIGAMLSGTLFIVYVFYSFGSITARTFSDSWAHFPPFFFTIPFVFYGIVRYEMIAGTKDAAEPEMLLFRDRPLLVTVIAWAVLSGALLYSRTIFGPGFGSAFGR